MKKLFYQFYSSPIGELILLADDRFLLKVEFVDQSSCTDLDGSLNERNSVLSDAICQLDEYFSGSRRSFDIPLSYEGTVFQEAAWKSLQSIPFGETRDYAEQARMTGYPKACRAIGQANHRNPISIIIPCHRILGKNGSLTGYAGGLEKKKWLLDFERDNTNE